MKNKLLKTGKVTLLTALVLSNLSWNTVPNDETNPPLLTIKGFTFTDYNRNGKLDLWEDTSPSIFHR